MKKLPASEIIFIVEDAPEGGFVARSIGNDIFTEGESLEDLKRNIKEAVECHFEEKNIPRVVRLHYTKEEVLAV